MARSRPERVQGREQRDRRMRAITFVLSLPFGLIVGIGLATFALLFYGGCLRHGFFRSCIADIPVLNLYGAIVITGPAGLAIAVPSLYWVIYRSSWIRWRHVRAVGEKERRFMEMP